ncbi:MAG: hypothetical protein JWO38_5954 [Gemmataceae bacterium]|nr:hypothetical protein [Gemmataceae bacterium]
MADDPKLKLELRPGPADGPPDPAVLDDILKLVRQGVVTTSKQARQVSAGGGFHPLNDGEMRELRALTTTIEHRIEQASAASQMAVEKHAETAKQPDARQQLAAESLAGAEAVVAAVQRAILRGVAVRIPDSER